MPLVEDRFPLVEQEFDYVFESAWKFNPWMGITLVYATGVSVLVPILESLYNHGRGHFLPIILCPMSEFLCPTTRTLEVDVSRPAPSLTRINFRYNSTYSVEFWMYPPKSALGRFFPPRKVSDNSNKNLVVAPAPDYYSFIYTQGNSMRVAGVQRILLEDIRKFVDKNCSVGAFGVGNSVSFYKYYLEPLKPMLYQNISMVKGKDGR